MKTLIQEECVFLENERQKNLIYLITLLMLVGCQPIQIEETGIQELYGRQVTVTSVVKDPREYCQLLERAGLKVYCFPGVPLQIGGFIASPNTNVLVISCKHITEESSEIIRRFLDLEQLTVFDFSEKFRGCGESMEMVLQIGT